MQYVEHPLVIPGTLEAREYQLNILKTAIGSNTLCVLPTGLGKTPIAIMLAAQRLEEYPDSKVFILAPTRPLCEQHKKSFEKVLDVGKNKIILLTGKIPAQNRQQYYQHATIVAATPQTIENDIKTGRLDLSNFSLLIIDEVHRAVKNYAYPFVCREYMAKAKNPRILGLTASPGSEEERIKEICNNLSADAVEIRIDTDRDVKGFVKEVDNHIVRVELTGELSSIRNYLKDMVKTGLSGLRSNGVNVYSKMDLLLAQSRTMKMLQTQKDPALYLRVSLIAEVMKVWHALELIETQSVYAFRKYIDKISRDESKAAKRLFSDERMIKVVKLLGECGEHPKIKALGDEVRNIFSRDKFSKLIVFSHFRDNIDMLKKVLVEIDGCRPIVLIGQSKGGLKQKEQIDTIKDYEADVHNCLITSSIGEEGLHLSSADVAVFYDSTSSEIRTIQRRGRVGRTKVGKIITLLTKGTRDETNYHSARRKETKMKSTLKNYGTQRTLY